MKRHFAALALGTGLTLIGVAALAQEGAEQSAILGDCRQDASAQTRLSACTIAIGGGKAKGTELAFAYLQRGLARAEAGELKPAIKDFDQAIKLAPKATDALYDRGVAYTQLGNWQAAQADFDRLLKIAPSDADALYMRAWVHSQRGDDEAAIGDLDAILGLHPDDLPALFDRGGLLLRAGRPMDATLDFTRVLALDSKAAAAAFNRGRANYLMARDKQAAQDFRLAMSLRPGNPYAALRLHLALARNGGGAAKPLEQAMAALAEDEWPRQLLLVYLKRVEGKEVLAALETVSEADRPRLLCEANYYLGALAEILGQPKAARAYFEAAIGTKEKSSVEFVDAKLALAPR